MLSLISTLLSGLAGYAEMFLLHCMPVSQLMKLYMNSLQNSGNSPIVSLRDYNVIISDSLPKQGISGKKLGNPTKVSLRDYDVTTGDSLQKSENPQKLH